MTANVISLDSYRKPALLAPVETVIHDIWRVFIPRDCEIIETVIPWSKAAIQALELQYEIDGVVIPYYYVGRHDYLYKARGEMLVCDVQLIKQVYKDGSWMISPMIRPRPDMPALGRYMLMALSIHDNQLTDYIITYTEPLPEKLHAKLVLVKEKRER